MHRDHLRQRGFNQATELARIVSRKLALPLSITRLQHTGSARHQRGLPRAQRLRRSDLAFRTRGPCPAHVAVLDDVVTTGATAEQASVALRQAGAKTVEVWAIARTPDRR
jgi:predicted amidophosphoribosyltransferase